MTKRNLSFAVLAIALLLASSAEAGFYQTDPVGYKDDLNLYAYVGNDPANKTDPMGLDSVTCQQLGNKSQCTVTRDKNGFTTYYKVVRETESDGTVTYSKVQIGQTNFYDRSDGHLDIDVFAAVLSGAFSAPTKSDRIISGQLDRKTLDAARRELKGEVVARRPNGMPYDHVTKVREAQQGLLNRMQQIRGKLLDPNMSDAEWNALQGEFGTASRALDYSEKFVPR